MNGVNFLRIVENAFLPFLKDFGFSMDAPSISGRCYRASFSNPTSVISVSFEPGDDAFFVKIFSRLDNNSLSDYDDEIKSPRLADLNTRYMHLVTSDERLANNAVFGSIQAIGREEARFLKYAKELRLVLPKYLAQQGGQTGHPS